MVIKRDEKPKGWKNGDRLKKYAIYAVIAVLLVAVAKSCAG